MSALVLLFDIDGTLVSTGGAGRRAIELAFERVHGSADACGHFSFAGMTDRAIARLGLEAIGVAATEAAIDALIEAYLAGLDAELARREAKIHEGMVAALDASDARARTAVGLGTGNVERGARMKLARVGIAERFAFGGFGSDHEDRAELLRVGAERGAARLGLPRSACRVVVIGDTPKDIAAARAIGAESFGVATGSYDVAALREAGATLACEHLGVAGVLDALLA